MMTPFDIEGGTDASPTVTVEGTNSWFRPATRRQNRWFGLAVAALFFAAVIFQFYGGGRDNTVLGGETDEGTVGNDALNAKMQQLLDHKEHGSSHNWSDITHATNGNPSWVHNHHINTTEIRGPHSVATQNDEQHGETEEDDSASGQNSQQDDVETEEAESDQQTSESHQGDESAWLATEVTLEDGVMYEVVDQLSHDANAFT